MTQNFDLSGAITAATGVGTNVDLSTLLQQNLTPDALNVITPQIRGAMQQGLQIAGDLTPAYAFVDKLAKGGSPDPQMTVAALAGAATVVNPIAGAAMMAAGELAIGVEAGLESLLKGLGLISDAPKPVQYVGLIPKGAPVPSGGPGSMHPDPLWMTWDKFARWWWPPSGATDYGWFPTAGQVGIAPIQSVAAGVAENLIHSMWMASPNYQQRPGNSRDTGLVVNPAPRNGFEAFLIPLMEKNLENWANANPYVDPRALLFAAIKAWNDKHASLGNPQAFKVTGGFLTPQAATNLRMTGDVVYSPVETVNPDWVGFLLGSQGDSTGASQRIGAMSINMGPLLSTQSAAAAPSPPRPPADPRNAEAINIASAAIAAAQSAGPQAYAAAQAVARMSRWRRYLPYAPAAIGLALFPVAGVAGPVTGGAASALWVAFKKR